jgi:beta-glucosidase/6-phospho-beta-glucosidase/beta-galactosidase
VRPSVEIFGYHVITSQCHDRYRLPVMHTETSIAARPRGDVAVAWLRKAWANVLRVRNDGMPIVGFTWYSLTDQVD